MWLSPSGYSLCPGHAIQGSRGHVKTAEPGWQVEFAGLFGQLKRLWSLPRATPEETMVPLLSIPTNPYVPGGITVKTA